MGEKPKRRQLLQLLGCTGLGALAGCSGTLTGEPSAGTKAEQASEATTTTTEATTSNTYIFSEGETYTYTVPDQSLKFVWKVTSVSGEEVTIEYTASNDDTTQSITLTGVQTEERNTAFDQAAEKKVLFFPSLRSGVAITQGHTLETGNTWSITDEALVRTFESEWNRATVEVTDTDSYAGVSGHNVTVTASESESTRVTFCINKEYPFALALSSDGSSGYVDTGSLILESAEQ